MSSDERQLISLDDLKARGWTATLVARTLGTPDKLARNRRSRKAAPMRLYALARVETAEARPEFAEAMARTAERRRAAAKAVATKKAALLRLVSAMPPVAIEPLAIGEVRRLARDQYQTRNGASICADASRQFLDRIAVNYIRHQMTSYDERLEEIAGRTGITEAITLVRQKIYSAIADAYPELSDECANQQERRDARAAPRFPT
jgi:hypothetical protein